MKPEAKAPVFWVLVALVIVLSLSLVGTVLEIQRFKRIIEQAQVHVDTIYRGTVLEREFCEKQIEEAKCKSL